VGEEGRRISATLIAPMGQPPGRTVVVCGVPRRATFLGIVTIALVAGAGCARTAFSDSELPSPTQRATSAPTTNSTSASSTTTATSQTVAGPVIFDCGEGQFVMEPTTYILYCGDAGLMLEELVWSNWGQPIASATGLLRVKNCVPDCASGTPIPYSTFVTVTGLYNGQYTRMHVSAPHAPEPDTDWTLDSSGPRIQNR
jgi:hypothetical protein